MSRTPQEFLAQHLEAVAAEDLDRLVADYSDDAFFITPEGVDHGKDGVRAVFSKVLADLPDATWRVVSQNVQDDILLLEWAADARGSRVEDGIDTIIFRDGLIRAQTVRYTLTRNGDSGGGTGR